MIMASQTDLSTRGFRYEIQYCIALHCIASLLDYYLRENNSDFIDLIFPGGLERSLVSSELVNISYVSLIIIIFEWLKLLKFFI
jgi:hypothetical protein